MDVRISDPTEEGQYWITEPTRTYHVELWYHQGGNVWACGEYRLDGAQDMHEALAWAESQASSEGATYALYAIVDDPNGEGRVWLTGANPTSSRGNFDRSHPSA